MNTSLERADAKGYLIFLEKVRTTQVFLRDSTAVSHYPLLLFGGQALRIDHDKGMVRPAQPRSSGRPPRWLCGCVAPRRAPRAQSMCRAPPVPGV